MWLKEKLSFFSASVPISRWQAVPPQGWPRVPVHLATAAVIKYFPSKWESIKNMMTKCTLHSSHVINLPLYLRTILLPLAGHNCGIFLSSEDTVPAWFLEGLQRRNAEVQKSSCVQAAVGGGTGDVQGTLMDFAEDTARSEPLYSLQTQLAAQALPKPKGLLFPHSAWAPTPTCFWALPKACESIYSCCKTPAESVQAVVTCS